MPLLLLLPASPAMEVLPCPTLPRDIRLVEAAVHPHVLHLAILPLVLPLLHLRVLLLLRMKSVDLSSK